MCNRVNGNEPDGTVKKFFLEFLCFNPLVFNPFSVGVNSWRKVFAPLEANVFFKHTCSPHFRGLLLPGLSLKLYLYRNMVEKHGG